MRIDSFPRWLAVSHSSKIRWLVSSMPSSFWWSYPNVDETNTQTQKRKRADLGFVDAELGLLTNDEVLFMRQIPAGFGKAEWTKKRLKEVRRRLSRLGEGH